MIVGLCVTAAQLTRRGARRAQGYKTVVEQTQVFIHPSSALFQRQPDWVIYHELVLTSKEYMREVCAIDPKWLVELAPRFFKSADPHKLSRRKRAERIEPLYDRYNDPNDWRCAAPRSPCPCGARPPISVLGGRAVARAQARHAPRARAGCRGGGASLLGGRPGARLCTATAALVCSVGVLFCLWVSLSVWFSVCLERGFGPEQHVRQKACFRSPASRIRAGCSARASTCVFS